MMFNVFVLRGSKAKPELVPVTTVLADRFELRESDARAFSLNNYGIVFYNDELGWWGKVAKSTMVAFLPGTDWVIERG